MTRLEEMLIEQVGELASQLGANNVLYARLDERLKRLEEHAEAAPASAPQRPRKGWRENGGLYLSNAAITAIVSALLTLLARPPAAPDAPRPPAAAVAGAQK